jgi:hypothetical protein
MLLSPEARRQVYYELRRQPRVWRFELGDILLIGA